MPVLGCSPRPGAQGIVVPVVRGDLEVIVPADGVLEATSASPVAVPRVPTGALKVKELVDEGTLVAKGDVVITFDESQLEIDLENNRASFRSAERRIDRTGLQSDIELKAIAVTREVAELERATAREFRIEDAEIYSKLDILQDRVREREAGATIVFADASLRLRGETYDIDEQILDVEKTQVSGKIERAETSLAQLVLSAPLPGMIVYKKNWRGGSVAVGDTLWPGNVVMSIVDPAGVQLKAWVLERDGASVKAGAEARVVVDAHPERPFAGRVKSVAELAAPVERGSPVKYFETTIEIADPDPALLKPGMKATAHVVSSRAADQPLVLRSALRGDPAQHWVLLETEDGPRRRDVRIGAGDAVRVAITEGLSGGESVLLDAEAPAEGGPGGASAAAPVKAGA